MSLTFLTLNHPWWVYVSMPFIAALVGYGTKLVLLKMIFEPVEFVGIKPFLGWQGMIPRRAAKMAGIAVDSVMSELLKPEELFDRIDSDELLKQIEGPLHDSIEKVTESVMSEFNPGIWEMTPDVARRALISRIESRTPEITHRFLTVLRENVDQVFDIKHMVVTNLVADKHLLNKLMRDISRDALKFIVRSGLIFGFLIGLVQVAVFILTGWEWVIPIFGLITGGFTDWIALHMIFRPIEPNKRLFGILPWQGLFHKLRKQVMRDYATLLSKEILTPRAVLDSLLKGPMSDKLFMMVEEETKKTIDKETGIARPFVAMAIGGRRYQDMKKRIAEKVIEQLPEHTADIEAYSTEALDLENLFVERMGEMSPPQYEELLRPAFRDDEKTVVIVGAILGFLVGELQVQLLLM